MPELLTFPCILSLLHDTCQQPGMHAEFRMNPQRNHIGCPWETDLSFKGLSSNLDDSLHCIPHEPLHSLSHLNCFPTPGCQLVCHPALLVGHVNDVASNLGAKLDAPCMKKRRPNALKHLRATRKASSFFKVILMARTMVRGLEGCSSLPQASLLQLYQKEHPAQTDGIPSCAR